MKTAMTLVAVASLGLLAACGEKAADTTATTEAPAAPAEPVTGLLGTLLLPIEIPLFYPPVRGSENKFSLFSAFFKTKKKILS